MHICKNGCSWAKHPILFGREQNFWPPYIRNPPRADHQYIRGYNFPIGPTTKKIISEERVVFWGSGPFLKSSASGRMCLYFWFKINETCVIHQFPKNKKVIEDYWVLARIDRVTADFPGIKLPKIAE